MMVPLAGRGLSEGADPFFSLQRQMNKVFDDILSATPQGIAGSGFKIDVKEDEKAYHVHAELPGLSEKEVEVTFEDGVLSIRGEKKVEREDKGEKWHIVERSSGSFARQLGMPANIDPERIEAKFEKGVLNITLNKLDEEKAKAKRIEVKAS
jgi:HSP20 family protein